jgi:hypothetical protein
MPAHPVGSTMLCPGVNPQSRPRCSGGEQLRIGSGRPVDRGRPFGGQTDEAELGLICAGPRRLSSTPVPRPPTTTTERNRQ